MSQSTRRRPEPLSPKEWRRRCKPADNATAERELRGLYSSLDAQQKQKIDWTPEKLQQEIAGLLGPWWRCAMGYSPKATLMKVTCPVLTLNGGKDTQVLAGENLKAIQEALHQGQNDHCMVKMRAVARSCCRRAGLNMLGRFREATQKWRQGFAPVASEEDYRVYGASI